MAEHQAGTCTDISAKRFRTMQVLNLIRAVAWRVTLSKSSMAIANVSSQIGVSVSSQVYAQQDIDRTATESVKVSLSDLGKGLASGESKKESNSDIDIAMSLLQMAQAAKAWDAAQAADEVAGSSAVGSGPSQEI